MKRKKNIDLKISHQSHLNDHLSWDFEASKHGNTVLDGIIEYVEDEDGNLLHTNVKIRKVFVKYFPYCVKKEIEKYLK